MIIYGKTISSVAKVYGEQNQVAKTAKTNKPQASSGKDEVILSSRAQEFGQIFNAIRGMDEVRPDKVNEIADKINDGTYKVDSASVAEKMLGGYLG